MDLGQLLIKVRASLGDLDSDLAEAKAKGAAAGNKIGDAVSGGVEDKLKALGGKLTKVLTPVAGAVAVTSTAIAQSWNGAQRDMQATTGATGARLDSLMGSVQNVAGTVKGGVGVIASTMAELAAKTGMTGPPLEHLTQQVLGLAELGIQVTAADVGGAFGRWAVPTDQWGAALERVFKVSQQTGQSVPTLLGRLSEFAPVLQGLGFNFDQASLLVGKLSDGALPGLKKALAEIVATGTTDVPGAFATMVASIRSAENPTAGMALAIETFGAKAGPELYSAITKGKFGVEQLSAAVDANHGSIAKTVDDNRTWIDQLGLLKDKAAAMIGPVAQQVSGVATVLATIGPAAQTIEGAISWVRGLGAASTVAATGQAAMAVANTAEGATAGVAAAPTLALAAGIWAVAWPVLAVIAGVALLVAGFLVLTRVFGLDTPTAIGILLLAIMPIVGIPLLIIANWDKIGPFFGDLLGKVGGFFSGAWDLITSGGERAFGWVVGKGQEFVDFVTGIPGSIADALGSLFSPLIDAARAAIHWLDQVKDKISSLPGGILSTVTGGLSDKLGITEHADGGFVPGPLGQPRLILAHGGETVTPTGDVAGALGMTGGERSDGGVVYNFNIGGSLVAERQIFEMVRNGAVRKRERNGSSGF